VDPDTLERFIKLGHVVDLLGTFVAAGTGAAAAIRKELDLVGIVVLAFLAGTAGGIIRDLLIGAVPPAAMSSLNYLFLALTAAAITMPGYRQLGQPKHTVLIVDAAGLGFFAVAGTEKALVHGIHPVLAPALGVLTAIGGGIVRDILVNEIPVVFRDRSLYATAALAGAVVVAVGAWLQLRPVYGAILGGTLAFALRLGAIWLGWRLEFPNYQK
jgi:uncharacterized membrane protein YeiH